MVRMRGGLGENENFITSYNFCNNSKIYYVPIAHGLCIIRSSSPQVFTYKAITDSVNHQCLCATYEHFPLWYHSENIFSI